MAITPQTNTTLKDIAQALLEVDDIVIGGHIGPDGDCIGSQLALMHALRACGKRAIVTLAKDEPIDQCIAYLPGSDQLQFAGEYDGPVGAFVAVDVPIKERLVNYQWALHEKAPLTITIDHHAVDSCMAQLSYTDPDAAATTMLVWEVAGHLNAWDVDGVAQCAYTGLLTDTGGFKNTNTDQRAFEAAAQMLAHGADAGLAAQKIFQQRRLQSIKLQSLIIDRMSFCMDGQFAISYLTLEDFERIGAVKADAEPMIDVLRSLEGVRVACVLREQEKDIRGSFRAKDDTDVAAIARHFDGGGHKAAAGFSVSKPMSKALDDVCAYCMKVMG